tara:strand:+ start:64 stop:438 length:375 start_codon:yes stop_codon:yes gene_type:complete
MSDELIYKVAEEIYQKQDEIKQEIIDLKDLVIENQIENKNKVGACFHILKENAVEMAKLMKMGNIVDKESKQRNAIKKLFEKHGDYYVNEKIEIYNRVGFDKFRMNYLDEKNRTKIDELLNIYG